MTDRVGNRANVKALQHSGRKIPSSDIGAWSGNPVWVLNGATTSKEARMTSLNSEFSGLGGTACEKAVRPQLSEISSMRRRAVNASFISSHFNFARRLIASQLRKDKDLACESKARNPLLYMDRARSEVIFHLDEEAELSRLAPVRVVFRRTNNNIFVSASNNVTGHTYISLASGSTGLQGKKRATPVAAESLGEYFAERLLPSDKKMAAMLETNYVYGGEETAQETLLLDLYIKSAYLDNFAKSFIKGLCKVTKRVMLKDTDSGRNKIRVRSIELVNLILDNKLSHNGVRKPKQRRV